MVSGISEKEFRSLSPDEQKEVITSLITIHFTYENDDGHARESLEQLKRLMRVANLTTEEVFIAAMEAFACFLPSILPE